MDKYTLSLNKLAGSMKGYKHSDDNKQKFSLLHRGKHYKKSKSINPKPPVTPSTIIKLRLRARGVEVYVYDKCFNLIKEFKTIKDTANFIGLSPSSVSKYITTSTIWNDTYYFRIKETDSSEH